MPQLRQNPITSEWVDIAPERSKRPDEFIQPTRLPIPSHDTCTFCPGGSVHEERERQYDTERTYLVKNKFPSFVEDLSILSVRTHDIATDFYHARPALGAHDVVVVNDGNLRLPTFTPAVWRDLLTTFQQRACDGRTELNVAATMPIYNHRPEAGASVVHPHAQLFSPTVVPPQLHREVHGSFDYLERNRRCVFCDLAHHEEDFHQRILAKNQTFVAFMFYASRFPFECWILPRAHLDRFEVAEPSVIRELSELLPAVFHRYDAALQDPPLNLWLHSLPNSLDGADFYHWHIEVAARLSTYGGYELGSGMVIDGVSPEHAAEFLRTA